MRAGRAGGTKTASGAASSSNASSGTSIRLASMSVAVEGGGMETSHSFGNRRMSKQQLNPRTNQPDMRILPQAASGLPGSVMGRAAGFTRRQSGNAKKDQAPPAASVPGA